jgi:hypothetical protein
MYSDHVYVQLEFSIYFGVIEGNDQFSFHRVPSDDLLAKDRKKAKRYAE